MMRMNLAVVGSLCLSALSVMAQFSPPKPSETLFRANEWSVDPFGSVSVRQETINRFSQQRVRQDGRLGAGLGVNYFFTRNIGFGADAYTEDTRHNFVDNASGNFIYRFPFDSVHLAPYVYGGGGHQFDPFDQWFAQAGAGLEVRFTPHLGVFTDGRYVFTDGTKNFGLARFGVRVSF